MGPVSEAEIRKKYTENDWPCLYRQLNKPFLATLLYTVARHLMGTPKSIEVNITKNSVGLPIEQFSEQVLKLTKLDWNTLASAVRRPITLRYAATAARMPTAATPRRAVVSLRFFVFLPCLKVIFSSDSLSNLGYNHWLTSIFPLRRFVNLRRCELRFNLPASTGPWLAARMERSQSFPRF